MKFLVFVFVLCAATTAEAGYLVDSEGQIVRNDFGDPWRTGFVEVEQQPIILESVKEVPKPIEVVPQPIVVGSSAPYVKEVFEVIAEPFVKKAVPIKVVKKTTTKKRKVKELGVPVEITEVTEEVVSVSEKSWLDFLTLGVEQLAALFAALIALTTLVLKMPTFVKKLSRYRR